MLVVGPAAELGVDLAGEVGFEQAGHVDRDEGAPQDLMVRGGGGRLEGGEAGRGAVGRRAAGLVLLLLLASADQALSVSGVGARVRGTSVAAAAWAVRTRRPSGPIALAAVLRMVPSGWWAGVASKRHTQAIVSGLRPGATTTSGVTNRSTTVPERRSCTSVG